LGVGFDGMRCAAMLVALALVLAACNTPLGNNLENPADVDLSARKPQPITTRGHTPAPGTESGSYQFFPGGSADSAGAGDEPVPGVKEAGGKFTINVDHADIGEVSKLILGETLGFTYVVDPRVQGTITLSTTAPLSSREVLGAFEASLRLIGAGLVVSGGTAKVVALQELVDGEMGTADKAGRNSPGFGMTAIPLHYVNPNTMMELMDSFIARSGNVRASLAGNMILVRGTAAERKSLVDVVRSFDVDWMANQSASIAILANAAPEDIVPKLEAIFAQDTAASGANAIKAVALERLNGVVIIGNSKSKVRRALGWVQKLDKPSQTDTGYFIYAVQNGNAEDLAKILSSTFLDKSGAPGLSSEVAPNQQQVQISTDQGFNSSGTTNQQQQQGASGQSSSGQPLKADLQNSGQQGTSGSYSTSSATQQGQQQQQPDLSSGVRITPNVATNSLVIRASPRQYRKILAILRQLDTPSVQVLVNTTIAEVNLTSELKYGVQAYLGTKFGNTFGGGVFNTNRNINGSFPGFNLIFGGIASPHAVLDALSAVTKVRVVSSPSILVLENQTATIKVGDQVPIQTQAQSVANTGTTGSTLTASYEYHDTGVILKVKPRINGGGMVTMDIAQELSAVTKSAGNTASELANPTFTDRSVSSMVSVASGQTVVLGGLISGQDSRDKNGVPIVNKIPIIGDLVGSTENNFQRNELVVFITPQVIQNGQDASRVSEELRDKMRYLGGN
jgi:general secretion pathway protein D